MIRYIGVAIVSFTLVFVSLSCSNEPLLRSEHVDLKLIGSSQEMFDANYGNPIVLDGYVIKVEVLPLQIASGEDFISATSNQFKSIQPDVILTNGMVMSNLTHEGLLMQIDQLVDLEQMDGLAQSIIQKLRNDGGDGHLYGLPTSYSSHVLYYNIDLFEQYGVPKPMNNMSWSEVLELEQIMLRSMADNGQTTYGMLEARPEEAASKLDQWIREYALSEELNDFDPTSRKLHIHNERWRNIWQEMIKAYQDYTMIRESNQSDLPYEDRLLSFASQRAPLMLGDSGNWYDWRGTDTLSFDWGIVSPPGRTNIYIQNGVVAISQDSIKQAAAWELIKHITSAHTTEKMLSITDDGTFPPKGLYRTLPARTKLLETKDKVDLSAFYVKQPALKGLYSTNVADMIPTDFYVEYRESRVQHIQAILDGELTVEMALASLQEEAQAILD